MRIWAHLRWIGLLPQCARAGTFACCRALVVRCCSGCGPPAAACGVSGTPAASRLRASVRHRHISVQPIQCCRCGHPREYVPVIVSKPRYKASISSKTGHFFLKVPLFPKKNTHRCEWCVQSKGSLGWIWPVATSVISPKIYPFLDNPLIFLLQAYVGVVM